jgi:hypothetical protein
MMLGVMRIERYCEMGEQINVTAPQGAQGVHGEQGVQGVQGVPGIQGLAAPVFSWWRAHLPTVAISAVLSTVLAGVVWLVGTSYTVGQNNGAYEADKTRTDARLGKLEAADQRLNDILDKKLDANEAAHREILLKMGQQQGVSEANAKSLGVLEQAILGRKVTVWPGPTTDPAQEQAKGKG